MIILSGTSDQGCKADAGILARIRVELFVNTPFVLFDGNKKSVYHIFFPVYHLHDFN